MTKKKNLTAQSALETDATCEASPLAARLSDALSQTGVYYRQQNKVEGTEHEPPALPPLHYVSWNLLGQMGDADPAAALETWQAIRQAARDELNSGHRAAAAIEHGDSTPMDRARFLAVREAMASEWQPRGGIEWTLLDQMAQAQTMLLHWSQQLVTRTQSEGARDLQEQATRHAKERKGDWAYGVWVPQRLTVAEAIQDAATHLDRWHRIFIRSMRQLRDLRRYNVVIHGAEQVNIADKMIVAQGGE